MRKESAVFGQAMIVSLIVCLTTAFTFATSGCSGKAKNQKGDDAVKIELKVPPIKVKVPPIKVNVETKRFEFKEDFHDRIEVSDIDDVNQALFFVEVGKLHVSYHDSDIAVVKVDYHVEASREKDLTEIIEETKLSTKINGNSLELAINKKDSNESIWEWADKNISAYSISADVEIGIPKQFHYFDLKTDTGSIEIDGLEGVVMLKVDTGSITAKNIRFSETSRMTVDTGNINLSLDKVEVYKSDVKIYTGTGNITIGIGNLPYKDVSSMPSSTDVSNKTIIVSDKCRISSSVDTGTVRLK